jgi:hypothetical protein
MTAATPTDHAILFTTILLSLNMVSVTLFLNTIIYLATFM